MERTTPGSTADEFYLHAAEAIASLDDSTIPTDVDFTIEQQVTEDDQVVSHYHLRIHAGTVIATLGAATAPDVTLRQDAATARSLRSGAIHAQAAFLTGRLSIDGDINKLLEHGSLLTRLLSTTAGRS